MQPTTTLPTTTRNGFGLRLQLVLALGLLGALIAAIVGTALWGLARVHDSARQATALDGNMSRLASQVAVEALLARRYEKDYFLNIGTADRSGYLAKWQQADADLGQAIEAFAKAASAPDDKQMAVQWRAGLLQYNQSFAEIEAAVQDGRITTAEAANNLFTPSKENIRVLTDTAVEAAG